MSKSWLQSDLNRQGLDKLRRLHEPDTTTTNECWIYQQSESNNKNQLFVTDLSTRLKLVVCPKKSNKLKALLQSRSSKTNPTLNSDSYLLYKVLATQYLFSSMIDFKSGKLNEPYVFMFLEDFQVKSDVAAVFKKSFVDKLAIGTHPSFRKQFERISSPAKPERRANPIQSPKGASKLTQLIGEITQNDSLADYTLEVVPEPKPSHAPATAAAPKSVNLNEAFVKNHSGFDTQSTLGSAPANSQFDLLTALDAGTIDDRFKAKLSSQCLATNLNQFDCSVIPAATDSVSSISITRKTPLKPSSGETSSLIDSDRETNNDDIQVIASSADLTKPFPPTHRLAIKDTQPNPRTQISPSQILKRRDTAMSEISSASLFDWPASLNPFASSTLSCQSIATGGAGVARKRRKLFTDREAYLNNISDDEEELDESASCVNSARSSRIKSKIKKTAEWVISAASGSRSPNLSRASSSSSSVVDDDDGSGSFDALSTSSSSSSVLSSCVTTATQTTQHSLVFAPRHLFEYKQRLIARRALTDKKRSPSRSNKFSVRDIFSPRAIASKKKPVLSTQKSAPGSAAADNKTPNRPITQLKSLNSSPWDDFISLHRLESADNGKSPSSKQSTPTRRRLFDRKTQDIEQAFADAQPVRKRAHSVSAVSSRVLAENTANNSANCTTAVADFTTVSSDKSIPGAQKANVFATNASTDKSAIDFGSKLSTSSSEKSTIGEPDMIIFNHQFSLDLNSFQDYMADSRPLILLDNIEVASKV